MRAERVRALLGASVHRAPAASLGLAQPTATMRLSHVIVASLCAQVAGYRPHSSRRTVISGAVGMALAPTPAVAARSRDGYPVQRTPEEWKAGLSEQQYFILREGGTEPQFSSPLLREKAEGLFHCAACDAPLFTSNQKFDSGTG